MLSDLSDDDNPRRTATSALRPDYRGSSIGSSRPLRQTPSLSSSASEEEIKAARAASKDSRADASKRSSSRWFGNVNRETVLVVAAAGAMLLIVELCLRLSNIAPEERSFNSLVFGVAQGNALERVSKPGHDNLVATAIMSMPVSMQPKLVKLAKDYGSIRDGRELPDIESALPAALRDSLSALRDVSASQGLPSVESQRTDHRRTQAPKVSKSCPHSGTNAKRFAPVAAEYLARNEAGGCLQSQGMWLSKRVAPVIRYKYEAVGSLFGLSRGSKVLDWGAGCGHAIDLLAGKQGFDAYALDLVEANAVWAKSHLKHIGSFCAMDGSTLHFPDESMDAVLSNGALVHADGEDAQCRIIRDQVLRVLRPGGCAWFGFNGFVDTTDCGEAAPQAFWDAHGPCFKDRKDVVVTTAKEMGLFGFSEYDRPDTYSIFMCKKWPAAAAGATTGALAELNRKLEPEAALHSVNHTRRAQTVFSKGARPSLLRVEADHLR